MQVLTTSTARETQALTAFQQQMLRAIAGGGMLFATASHTYLSMPSRVAPQSGYRCLRIISPSDFAALEHVYIRVLPPIPGGRLRVYELTRVGQQIAGGLSDEA